MRDIERDILLASSGELSWWRRVKLHRRITRDAEARRLAETLAVTSLVVQGAAPRPRMSPPMRWGLAGAAVAACVMGMLIVWKVGLRPGADPTEGESTLVIRPAIRPSSAALHESSRRLLLANMQLMSSADTVSQELAKAPTRWSGDGPPLPPWSSGLLDGIGLRDISLDRSQ